MLVSLWGCVYKDIGKWSSFGHRSELPFSFEFLRCVHFVHDISCFWYTTLEF